ncbi:flagellar export protein FliJ [Enterovibrio makurazakiensis]|uniref:Flagellar FliJ protein n=1 Tax=Enterovibrio gelatinilyticus TaxID=2899819 RepID=A0ABT5QZV4_9GAMM|nr:flagellar export protein FliJ [Enterovibrio sp. ZSDZ42]MDD1793552.1 flagellar export protein FliJ [Enterovibrio sp. ZSDZ42]
MRRIAAVSGYRDQQQKRLDDLKAQAGNATRTHLAHQERFELLEGLKTQYGFSTGNQVSAILMKGTVRFRGQLESLSVMQKQEMALSEIELRSVNERVVSQHRQVKMCEKVIEKRLTAINQKKAKSEQKMMDELAMQASFRRRLCR